MPDDELNKLIADLKDENLATRYFAVLNLGEAGNPRAIQPFKDLLEVEKSKNMRGAIQVALRKLSPKYKSGA